VSKKYKDKVCVYCANSKSATVDHIIGREFFLPSRRKNLDIPKVPACRSCNGEKSELEHYLMAVLPFGARHPDAAENLMEMVPKRLSKNARLHAELAAGFDQSGGTALPIDHVRLERLFAFIAKGLVWHHWKTLLEPGYSAIASLFDDAGVAFFDQIFEQWKTPNRATGNIGEGTFCYEGAQATDCPQMTVWRISMYGGIQFGGDPRVTGPSSLAVAITGPDAFIQRLQSKVFQ
jgi:hypothetical protein